MISSQRMLPTISTSTHSWSPAAFGVTDVRMCTVKNNTNPQGLQLYALLVAVANLQRLLGRLTVRQASLRSPVHKPGRCIPASRSSGFHDPHFLRTCCCSETNCRRAASSARERSWRAAACCFPASAASTSCFRAAAAASRAWTMIPSVKSEFEVEDDIRTDESAPPPAASLRASPRLAASELPPSPHAPAWNCQLESAASASSFRVAATTSRNCKAVSFIST